MGSKVIVTVAWGKKEKNASIKISAKTLGGAAKELDKRDEWGKFDGKIEYEYDFDGKALVTAVTLKPSYTIQMPTWAGYSKAPKGCQKEWDRMWKKLEEHEDGHRLIHQATLAKIQATLAKQTDLTVDQLKSDFATWLDEGQDNHDKFDTSTGNGSKKGVELDISSECE
jgi:predicted secreted Zn-dependent protease